MSSDGDRTLHAEDGFNFVTGGIDEEPLGSTKAAGSAQGGKARTVNGCEQANALIARIEGGWSAILPKHHVLKQTANFFGELGSRRYTHLNGLPTDESAFFVSRVSEEMSRRLFNVQDSWVWAENEPPLWQTSLTAGEKLHVHDDHTVGHCYRRQYIAGRPDWI